MTQTLPKPEGVQLALREIAEARQHLQLASDALSAFDTAEAAAEAPPVVLHEPRPPEIEAPPQNLLDIAHKVIHQVLPEQLAQERFKLAQVRETGCIACTPCPVSPGAFPNQWRPLS